MRHDDEYHVRRYLAWLDDPASLIDRVELTSIEQRFAQTHDVMEKLHIAEEINKAENPDPAGIQSLFDTHAKHWANVNEISMEAFLRIGVPEQALRRAGIRSTRGKAKPRANKQRVTTADVAKRLPHGPFTTAALTRLSGASTVTMRRSIQQLIEAGTIVAIGPDDDHQGRGRTPILYERAGQSTMPAA